MEEPAVEVGEAGAARKLDPETLVLRARPAPPIRFKRGLIVALTAIAIAVLVLTAWFALKPRSFHFSSGQRDSAEPAKAPGDALSALPATYGDAPKLGPPLPGDLGRPLLKHQQAMEGDATPRPAGPDESAQAVRAQAGELMGHLHGDGRVGVHHHDRAFGAAACVGLGGEREGRDQGQAEGRGEQEAHGGRGYVAGPGGKRPPGGG